MNKNSIEQTVADKLKQKKLRISFAESCTGGLCAARFISANGASEVLDASLITYSVKAKIKYLGIDKNLIDKYGVVSEQTALAMARGAAQENNADIGVGVTGYAGPTSDDPKIPVGTVCFGFYDRGKEICFTKHFKDMNRNKVRLSASDFVFEKLNEII